jgi:hypothetical protein
MQGCHVQHLRLSPSKQSRILRLRQGIVKSDNIGSGWWMHYAVFNVQLQG